MLFGTWLKAQKDRASPIGDLSRDFLQSIEMLGQKPSQFTTPAKFKKEHLKGCTWDKVLFAFEDAVTEYKEFK